MSPSEYLREMIAEAGGAISVERFMQEALYHPTFGYYCANVRQIGRAGDFSTSATLHPALGTSVAGWLRAHSPEVRARGRWHVIELGPGDGSLGASVLRGLGWWGRRGLRYHLVELSPGLRAAQRERLGGFARNVQWHDGMAEALAAAGGRALIFSNEFVDAFPCVQLILDPASGDWQEVCVTWPDGNAAPVEKAAPWTAPADWLPPMDHPPGQRVEAHLSYRRWLHAWSSNWSAGRMLTIDYGDWGAALYRRRPRGTLRAYCRHLRLEGLEVYQRFGQQDLTVDVNFTDLQAWGEELGWQTASLLPQREFLGKWLSPRWQRRFSEDARFAFLMRADGAGEAFKVLDQSVSSVAPGKR